MISKLQSQKLWELIDALLEAEEEKNAAAFNYSKSYQRHRRDADEARDNLDMFITELTNPE